jgi:hypothetical protein
VQGMQEVQRAPSRAFRRLTSRSIGPARQRSVNGDQPFPLPQPRWTSLAVEGSLITCSFRSLHSRTRNWHEANRDERGPTFEPGVRRGASRRHARRFRCRPGANGFDKLVRAATGADWPSVLAAREELTSLADDAVPKVTEAARSHGEARVRRACYELLTSAFAKDERAIDTVVRFGLTYERLRAEAVALAAAGRTASSRAPVEEALRLAPAEAVWARDRLTEMHNCFESLG